MTVTPIKIIEDQINNAYGRARKAFEARDPTGYQRLAVMQAERGAEAIDLNIEPILNSIAASRTELDEMIDIVRDYDMRYIVMASERFLPEGDGAQCFNPQDAYATVLQLVEMLVTRAGRTIDDIIIDPGLAPVGADTYGLVNIGLDTMRLCSADPDLAGIHFSVGLTNFAWGTPKGVRDLLEQAYLTIGSEVGLDMAMANIERNPQPLASDHQIVQSLREALAAGRATEGESVEDAGFRQAMMIMDICRPYTEE